MDVNKANLYAEIFRENMLKMFFEDIVIRVVNLFTMILLPIILGVGYIWWVPDEKATVIGVLAVWACIYFAYAIYHIFYLDYRDAKNFSKYFSDITQFINCERVANIRFKKITRHDLVFYIIQGNIVIRNAELKHAKGSGVPFEDVISQIKSALDWEQKTVHVKESYKILEAARG